MSFYRPIVAAALSALVPGLGQLYNRRPAAGAATLVSTLGIWLALAWTTLGPPDSRSWLTAATLLVAYPFLLVPAVLDAVRDRSDVAVSRSPLGSRWQIIVLLLAIGPLALPQLWQSDRFSRRAKLAWTLAVALIALLAILMIVVIGPLVESWLAELSELA